MLQNYCSFLHGCIDRCPSGRVIGLDPDPVHGLCYPYGEHCLGVALDHLPQCWCKYVPYVFISVDVAFQQPLRYGFESLMVNEFHTLNGTCTTLVPSGPGYENAMLANQVCTAIGSQPGMATVPGDAYTYVSFGYSYSNLWRVCDRRCDLAHMMTTDNWMSCRTWGFYGFSLLASLGPFSSSLTTTSGQHGIAK